MSVTAPQGFVAAGGHVGIKASGNPDLAIAGGKDPAGLDDALAEARRAAGLE